MLNLLYLEGDEKVKLTKKWKGERKRVFLVFKYSDIYVIICSYPTTGDDSMKKIPYMSEEIQNQFWPLYETKLEPNSRKTYWGDIKSFVRIVEKDFLDITQKDVDRFYRYHTQENPIKLATLQKKFRELSAFSDFIRENIADLLGNEATFENYFSDRLAELNAKVKMAKGHIPTIREMDKILRLAAKKNIMHYAIFSLIYRCAVKPMELTKILPTDFLNTPDGRYLQIGEKKSKRIIPIPDDITVILDQYNKTRNKHATYYFYQDTYKKINERTLERLAHEYSIDAGISPITMYGIRDASLGLMHASGATSASIARDTGLTEMGVERYKDIVPAYTLKESAIDLVRIRILPFGAEN